MAFSARDDVNHCTLGVKFVEEDLLQASSRASGVADCGKSVTMG